MPASGHKAEGTAEKIREYSRQKGIECLVLPLKNSDQGIKFASRRIRDLIVQGRFQEVVTQLGRPYRLQGKVVTGRKLDGQSVSRRPISLSKALLFLETEFMQAGQRFKGAMKEFRGH